MQANYDHQLKTAAREALQAAQAWIDAGSLDKVYQKNIGGLVNTWSKLCCHPVTQQIDDILGRVAQGVWASFSQDSLCRWETASLVKVANGFSKCTRKEASQVLVLLAQVVNRKATSPTAQAGWAGAQFPMTASDKKPEGLPEDKGWDAWNLALMANALCKAEGADVEQALGHMAKAINERKDSLKDWPARYLAMMASALCKAEGADVRDDVQQAIGHMAKAINERKNSLKDWNSQSLAMMANVLGKTEGADVRDHVQQALGLMAKAINERKDGLTEEKGWTAQHLSMVANALGNAEGDDVHQALGHLAKAINQRKDRLTEEKGWNAQSLAMMANGLGKAEGKEARDDVQQALGHLAKAINKRKGSLTEEKGWNAQNLSMMANGLCRASGTEIRMALIQIEKAVSEQDLANGKGQGVQTLKIMMFSIGQYCAPGLLKKIVSALVKEAEKAPGALAYVLNKMSRFWLSGRHLDAAGQLLEALMRHGFEPDDQRAKDEILWNTTLLYFAEQQQKDPDPKRLRSFKQAYKHYLPRKPRIQGEARKAERPDDLWHILWSADYWEKDDILAPTGAMDTRSAGQPDTPRLQKKVFNQLQKALPGHSLQMEVPVRDFPVDIMIDGRICVEVDGSDHFVEVRAEGGAAGQFVRERRTKDLFIDDMLRRYGYQVFRISDAENANQLTMFVNKVRSALDTAPDSRQRSQSPKTVARQEEVNDQGFQPVQRRRRHKKAPAAAVR